MFDDPSVSRLLIVDINGVDISMSDSGCRVSRLFDAMPSLADTGEESCVGFAVGCTRRASKPCTRHLMCNHHHGELPLFLVSVIKCILY